MWVEPLPISTAVREPAFRVLADTGSIVTASLAVEDWIALPDHPHHRNTVRHASAAHLGQAKRATGALASLLAHVVAACWEGAYYKVDGHTRSYLWERGELPRPDGLHVTIYRVASRAELDALYEVSIAAFAENFLYTPISREAFHAQYGAILPQIDPRLVLLAEHGGTVVGYVFVVPDLLEQPRTGRVTTVIVKTLAVHPAHNGRGLGGLLVDRVQQAAAGLGFTRIIHALMFASNRSQQISRHYGAPFRRYAVFSRPTS